LFGGAAGQKQYRRFLKFTADQFALNENKAALRPEVPKSIANINLFSVDIDCLELGIWRTFKMTHQHLRKTKQVMLYKEDS
jgi:hypothetical protein